MAALFLNAHHLNKRLPTDIEVEYIPVTNALYLARQSSKLNPTEVEAMVLERARALGGAAMIKDMELVATASETDLARKQGRIDDVIKAYDLTLSNVNVLDFTEQSDGELIESTMEALLGKHTLLVIQGQMLSDEEKRSVTHITSIGGWNQPVHDLLDVLHAATLSNAPEPLEHWLETHGKPYKLNWESKPVQDWAEQHPSSIVRLRLLRILQDFI